MTPKRTTRRAFTLVEMIATMAVLGAVGSVAGTLVYSATRSYTDAARSAQLQTELSGAMERIVRELRWIGIDPDQAPIVPLINSVSATSITWQTNYSLALVSGELRYTAAGGTHEVLLRDVASLTISTFNDSNTALAATLSGTGCDPIRRIQVQITMTRGGVSQTLRTRVYLRSLMEGA